MFNTSIRVRRFNLREISHHDKQNNSPENVMSPIESEESCSLKSVVKMKKNLLANSNSNCCGNNDDDHHDSLQLSFQSPHSNKETFTFSNFKNLFWSIPMEQAFSAFPFATPNLVCEKIAIPALDLVMNEFKNAAILTFGQTGSGKSYSCFGILIDPENMGFVPRCIQEIFHRINNNNNSNSNDDTTTRVELSFYEFYDEKVLDMLDRDQIRGQEYKSPKFSTNKLTGEIGISHVKRVSVESAAQAMKKLERGMNERSMVDTKMSRWRTRTTSIVEIRIISKKTTSNTTTTRVSSLKIIDSCGSEKVKMGGLHPGREVTDKNIMTGLNTIRKCIEVLSENQMRLVKLLSSSSSSTTTSSSASRSQSHRHLIPLPKQRFAPNPFFESVVTIFLQDIFLGKCKTFILGTISPHEANEEETLSTINYVSRFQRIKMLWKHHHVKQQNEEEEQAMVEVVSISDDDNDSKCDWLKPSEEYDSELFAEADAKWNNHGNTSNSENPVS